MIEIENLKKLKEYLSKASAIIGEVIKLKEKLAQTEDEKEASKINSKIEDKVGQLMVQMLKIQGIQ